MPQQSAKYVVNPEQTFFEYVSKQKHALAASVATVPQAETLEQIEQALTFMEYYMSMHVDDTLETPWHTISRTVLIDSRKSVFEILLDLHATMRTTYVGFNVYFHGDNAAHDGLIKLLLEFPNFSPCVLELSTSEISISPAYCTMVVFESCDLESATDMLAKSWQSTSAPWYIKNILVQETVQEEFLDQLKTKLRPFSEEQRKLLKDSIASTVAYATRTGLRVIQGQRTKDETQPTLVYGSSVEFLSNSNKSQSPVNVVNVFRTAKEAVSMANASDGGSVSLWTEDLSLTFEVAYAVNSRTVWVNSCALFNPAVPYSFRKSDYCHGSVYAIVERKLMDVFVGTEKQPVSNNNAALSFMGLYCKQGMEQRNSIVQNVDNVHYEMVSKPYDLAAYTKGHRLELLRDYCPQYHTTVPIDHNLVSDTIYNQRKTVVIPFGVSFAN